MTNAYTQRHQDHQAQAQTHTANLERLLATANQLYRDRSVVVSLFDRPVTNSNVRRIAQAYQRAQQLSDVGLQHALQVLDALNASDIKNSQVDIGRLAQRLSEGTDAQQVLTDAQAQAGTGSDGATDVVLYGFGRIGRILTRLMLEDSGLSRGLNLRAIVVRKSQANDLVKRVSLLERDSVHGWFDGTVIADEDNQAIIANGQYIQVIYADDPSQIDYTQYGINNALVIDNTGKWRDPDGMAKHLQSQGVAKVLLTAPSKGDMKNVVFAVNDNDITADDKLISAASCTTNAITPALKVLHDEYGVQAGHVETIHSYTNDQNLVDNYHKAERRGRAAAMNMVITETGAAKAVAKALPALKGKLTGNSIRVPTPNVSLAVLNVTFDRAPADAETLNNFMRQIATSSEWSAQIDYTDSPDAVSTDYISAKETSIFDAKATIVSGNQAHLYLWYDNEMGYSAQVLRVAQKMAGVTTPKLV